MNSQIPPPGGSPLSTLPPSSQLYPAVITAYARVLGIFGGQASVIISQLIGSERNATNAGAFFARSANLLRSARLRGETMEHNNGVYPAKPIASGSYGEIARTSGGRIYKILHYPYDVDNQKTREEFYRGAFLELFIQVLLHTDPQFSQHIPRVDAMYQLVDENPRGLVIVMEAVPMTLTEFISGHTPLGLATMGQIIQNLTAMLAMLQKAYGFYHRDLHYGNLMVSATGQLMLIDFGMSCVTLNGRTYSVKPTVCESHDLLILFASLLDAVDSGRMRGMAAETVDALRSAFEGSDGVNYYQRIKDWHDQTPRPPLSMPFHYFYNQYSLGVDVPAPWGVPRGRPWRFVPSLEREAAVGERSFYDAFMESGVPAGAEPLAMYAKWGGEPSLKGGARHTRRHRSRRRRSGSKGDRRRGTA